MKVPFHSETFNKYWCRQGVKVSLAQKLPTIRAFNTAPNFDRQQYLWERYINKQTTERPPLTSIVVGGKAAEKQYL